MSAARDVSVRVARRISDGVNARFDMLDGWVERGLGVFSRFLVSGVGSCIDLHLDTRGSTENTPCHVSVCNTAS
jgi:hypothetical protein